MTEQLTVSLQPSLSSDKDESLESLIARISAQKGSFKDVTEAKLEHEIRNAGSHEFSDAEDHGAHEEESAEDAKVKQDELYKSKEEMLKHVSQARNESATALDFVSLLLSRYPSSSGKSSMSPFLQQNVPLGSLGVEPVQRPAIGEAEKRNNEMVAMGWRVRSLNSAADSLLASATRLGAEVRKETNYWDKLLTVKDEGWSVSRLPRDKHTLGVRFGFTEAYTDFRERGLAALRQDTDGEMYLDRGAQAAMYRQLRVRILQRGKPIATSRLNNLSLDQEESSIAKQILWARDGIFDEELHLECHREARALLGNGIICEGSKVLLPFNGDKQIEIDLVGAGGDSEQAPLDHVSEAIVITLRILLSQAHRHNLSERSKIPPPLRSSTNPRPIYALLKPLQEVLSRGATPVDIMLAISAAQPDQG